MTIRVDGENVEVVTEFPVLHVGWELDYVGWIVRKNDGALALVMSNHGREYFADRKEAEDKLAEYREAIQKTEAALKLLSPPPTIEQIHAMGVNITGGKDARDFVEEQRGG